MEQSITILLLEEDESESRLIQSLLSGVRFGQYQLDWCSSYENAYQKLVAESDYDIVLLDYLGFAGRGHNLLGLAVNRRFAPVIVLTEESNRDLDIEVMRKGASDYLVHGRIDAEILERSLRYAIERKKTETKLARLAHYDALTGLPNRILFRDRLEHAIELNNREQTPFALMYVDLDGFKQVNDSLGHKAGDALLQTIAGRLQDCIRRSDSVARIGGDEFTVLLQSISTNSKDIALVAQKIIDEVAKPFTFGNHRFNLGASVGIAVFPIAGSDADSLQQHADMAMYQAKAESGNKYRFYTEQMNIDARNQLLLEADLRRAVRSDEFIVHYQPRIAVETGELVGVEALVRWQHPERGMVSPAEFIPVAEATGLITPIGYSVISQVCRDLNVLRINHFSLRQAAINLSYRQFLDDKLVERVALEMKRYAIQPGQLEFELTETAMMTNLDQVSLCMRALNHLGAYFSLG